MREIAYTCRFCGQTRVFTWTLSDLAMLDLAWDDWVKNLSCQPCCDFFKSRQKLCDRIYAVCNSLITARQHEIGPSGKKRLGEVEQACKLKFQQLGAEFTKLYAEHYGKSVADLDITPFWDALFQNPLAAQAHIRAQGNSILSVGV